MGADLVDRADLVRRRADRACRRVDPRGERYDAPTAERPAARRGRGGASRCADRDAVCAVAARPVAHEARRHEERASGIVGRGARPAGLEDAGGIVVSDPQLFGDEHVRRYVETDGEVGYTWREGAPILILTVNGRKSGKEYSTPLIFGEDGDNYVLVGSQGGRPQHPDWYLNLAENPEVRVQVKADKFHAR